MGFFDFFKKKEVAPDYDVTDLSVRDIRVGYLFDYDMTTWEIVEEYEYDWGNGNYSYEFKLTDGNEVRYLAMEDGDTMYLAMTKKLKIREIAQDLPEQIVNNQKPPTSLTFDGCDYLMELESPGYVRVATSQDWNELMTWSYEDKDGKNVLNLVRLDDFAFDASVGKRIEEYEITNILPVADK